MRRYDRDMRSRTSLIVLLFAVGLFALPQLTHAAIPFFGPIIPQAGDQGVCAAGWGMVITVINNIIQFLITLVIVFIAPLMLAYSGFLYVVNPVDPSGIKKAKDILKNTVLGLIIALAGWMIVDAIMAVLYDQGKQTSAGALGVWSNLISSDGTKICIPLATSLKQAAPSVPGVTVVPPTANCAVSYAASLPGISVSSSGNCCDKTQSTCTSLDGMLSNTVQQIVNVKNKCGAVTVTGGTEVGHASEGGTGSHSSGAKVDLAQNVVSCITGTTGSSTINPPSFGSSQAKDKCGNIYTWEGNHTDIYVQSTCSL